MYSNHHTYLSSVYIVDLVWQVTFLNYVVSGCEHRDAHPQRHLAEETILGIFKKGDLQREVMRLWYVDSFQAKKKILFVSCNGLEKKLGR